MSIICGVLKTNRTSASEKDLHHLTQATKRYGLGEISIKVLGHVAMGFQPFETHERSHLEVGPTLGPAGDLVCFDGRLDNHHELARKLDLTNPTVSDSEIVLAAFARWGAECFSRFTGDWAVALWSELDDRLYLARDHAGSRTLYLERASDGFRWSTYLDSFEGQGLDHLSKDYAASYLSCLPVQERTPYESISSVRPGHYIAICDRFAVQSSHWSPLIQTSIQYGSDAEYDEHFLDLFGRSVARRTGPGAKVLAQLSGGMDSTAIVCMSDHLRLSQDPGAELLDTISYYDDSESSLDERSYFEITEARRGKVGIHLNTAISQRAFDPPQVKEGIYRLPGADSFSISQERLLKTNAWDRGYRVVLSGIGGDEVLGGIPDPLPELAGYLVTGNVSGLLSRSLAWCLTDRTPLIFCLRDTLGFAFRLYGRGRLRTRKGPPWLSPELRRLSEHAERAYVKFPERLAALPHQLDNALSWWQVMETLPHTRPQLLFRPEYRYPMLDKDLVTYLFSIPRDQLLRPGRRRTLMRRALQGIVPLEILERRRKAFQLRAPLNAMQRAQEKLDRLWDDSHLAEEGFVDIDRLRHEQKRCSNGAPEWSQALMKTIAYELWLRASHTTTSGSEVSMHGSAAFEKHSA
ncbi:asparagine synthetase B family protein [Granulicella paludicola]|uniref:asparagine synthetase B family protein n=1 Tax=Granulicella paludicola TaxID=474951 RepID=UPI0021DFA37B|nr:asparagine synthase-related protein [Granulicella paludicola]